MERVVVVFDIYNPQIDTASRIVRMWNSDKTASEYVNEYIERRSDLFWGYNDEEDLKDFAPGALFEFHGYSDEFKTECKDIITVYHVEAEDPDEDPMKRILNKIVPDFNKAAEEANEDNDEEAPYLKYAAHCFQKLLDDINKVENNNLERGS